MCNYDFSSYPAPGAVWKGMGRLPGSSSVMLVAALLLAYALTGCVMDADEDPWSIGVGDACPEFVVELDDGTAVSTADLAGRRTMMVFFNTSCADCRRELPEIQKVADCLAADGGEGADAGALAGRGIPQVICVSRGEGAASVAAYWEAAGLTLPYSPQDDAAVYRLFAESEIPRVYIIGGDLAVEAAYAGDLPGAGELLRLMR